MIADRDREIRAVFLRDNTPILEKVPLSIPPEDGQRFMLRVRYDWPCEVMVRRVCQAYRSGRFVFERFIGSEWVERHRSPETTEGQYEWAPTDTLDYRVRAVDADWCSPLSNEVERTVPEALSGIGAEANGRTVTIRWDPAAGAGGYRVLLYEDLAMEDPIGSHDAAPGATSVTFQRDVPGTLFYLLRAFNADGWRSSSLRSIDLDGAWGFVRVENHNRYLEIFRVRIGEIEYVRGRYQGIDHGESKTYAVDPGTYDWLTEDGHLFDYPPEHRREGTVTVTVGDTAVIVHDAGVIGESLEELLTGGQASRAWDGDFRNAGGVLLTATYTFRDDGTYSLVIPGFESSSGTYRELSRSSNAVAFQAGVREMTLQNDQFLMDGGPLSSPLIVFRPR